MASTSSGARRLSVWRRPLPTLERVADDDGDDDDDDEQGGHRDQKVSVAFAQAEVDALPPCHLLAEFGAFAFLALDTLLAAFQRGDGQVFAVWTCSQLLHAAAHAAVIVLRLLLRAIALSNGLWLRRLRARDGGAADDRPVAFAALFALAR